MHLKPLDFKIKIRKMEHKTGLVNVVISMISSTTAIITADVQAIVSLTAGLIAIASGCMAIRYYYYSTKKIKK